MCPSLVGSRARCVPAQIREIGTFRDLSSGRLVQLLRAGANRALRARPCQRARLCPSAGTAVASLDSLLS